MTEVEGWKVREGVRFKEAWDLWNTIGETFFTKGETKNLLL